jgi:hypothetical protein
MQSEENRKQVEEEEIWKPSEDDDAKEQATSYVQPQEEQPYEEQLYAEETYDKELYSKETYGDDPYAEQATAYTTELTTDTDAESYDNKATYGYELEEGEPYARGGDASDSASFASVTAVPTSRSTSPVIEEEETATMDIPASPTAPFAARPGLSGADAASYTERLPLPAHQPKLAEIDPTLYEYWREHIHQGFQRNNRMFDTILDAFMRPYNTTIWMYRILFGLGVAAFLVAAALGAWLREPMFSLIFGGLSIVSFLTYFIGRPLQSLEENLKFITWLGIIYNTYWTRLVYMMDSETIHQDLEDATQDAIGEIERLLDKHHEFSGKRPGLR